MSSFDNFLLLEPPMMTSSSRTHSSDISSATLLKVARALSCLSQLIVLRWRFQLTIDRPVRKSALSSTERKVSDDGVLYRMRC
jgi:hypothetical protein